MLPASMVHHVLRVLRVFQTERMAHFVQDRGMQPLRLTLHSEISIDHRTDNERNGRLTDRFTMNLALGVPQFKVTTQGRLRLPLNPNMAVLNILF